MLFKLRCPIFQLASCLYNAFSKFKTGSHTANPLRVISFLITHIGTMLAKLRVLVSMNNSIYDSSLWVGTPTMNFFHVQCETIPILLNS